MNEIVSYGILSSKSRETLIQAVDNAIREGWQPLGGVSIAVMEGNQNQLVFCQALVKYKS